MTSTPTPSPPSVGLLLVEGEEVVRLGLTVGIRQQLGVEPLVFTNGNDLITYLGTAPLESDRQPWLLLCDAQTTVNDAVTPWLWQWIKRHYPNLRVILTVRPAALELVQPAQQAGVEGIYPRQIALSELVAGIVAIAQGEIIHTLTPPDPPLKALFPNPFNRWRYQLLQEGLMEMDTWLRALDQHLGQASLSSLERLICEGRHREIRAARWLVARFLPQPSAPPPPVHLNLPQPTVELRATLVDRCLERAKSDLLNFTSRPLELDVLRVPQRRELLYTVLQQWDAFVRTLQATSPNQDFLQHRRDRLLRDLWEQSLREFFSPYRYLDLGGDRDLIDTLLADADVVVDVFLTPLPLVPEFLAHLLWQHPLNINQHTYRYGTPEALDILDVLLDHWLLTLANAIVYPLLNRLCYSAPIQQTFFSAQYISSREMERFRNTLSWHYRWQRWVKEPQNIFESRLVLLRLSDRGIQEFTLTLPRQQELLQLEGIPYALTLALETRDALAPPVRAVVAWVGKGVIYLLTQVIGRGLGLIGRGILQGIGQSVSSSWSTSETKKPPSA
ncbi:DUF3685 domain-containing protein [Synechococcus sp. PCC 6717]|nr:DUF3685 domain-containing protein [Synechococcus sp. PCC 6717]